MEINLGGFLFAATTLPLLTVNQHSCELHQEAKANFCKLLWSAHNFTGTVVSEEVSGCSVVVVVHQKNVEAVPRFGKKNICREKQ